MAKIRLSIIIAVLDSHEVVRRQLLYYFKTIQLPKEAELIIVDDGSDPSLRKFIKAAEKDLYHELLLNNMNICFIETMDKRPWSQPRARNIGANYSIGDYLLFTDVDHFFSGEAIQAALKFSGDKMHFPREWAILDKNGKIDQSKEKLFDYGLSENVFLKNGLNAGSHYNSFCIRKTLFDNLGGYDERFCGKYGGDDTDFSKRYSELCNSGKAKRSIRGPKMFVFPDPRRDVKKMFHSLRGG